MSQPFLAAVVPDAPAAFDRQASVERAAQRIAAAAFPADVALVQGTTPRR